MDLRNMSSSAVAVRNETSRLIHRDINNFELLDNDGTGLILACVYLIIALTCVGCNLLVSSMICLEKGLRKRPQPLLLLNTAIFDLVKGVIILLFTVPTCLWRGLVYPEAAYLVYVWLDLVWRHESMATMVFISACRYIVVCRKHCRSLRKDSRRQVVAAMVMSWFFTFLGSVCFTWTRLYVPDVVTMWTPPMRTTNGSQVTVNSLGQRSRSPKGRGLSVADFVFLLALFVSLACFIKVAREFHIHPYGRAPMNGVNHQRIKREKGVTKMCGVMVSLKFLSESFSVTTATLEQLKGPSTSLVILSSLVRDCTCALNPLIYFIGSPRCRSNVRKMFAKLCLGCRSNKVLPQTTRQSVFQLERRLSLMQGAQGGRTQQRPPVSVPDIFQVNRRVTTYDGQPILVIELDNATSTGGSTGRNATLKDGGEEKDEAADDIRDDCSNLAPESMIGNVSLSSSCVTAAAGHINQNNDGDASRLEVLMSKTSQSRTSDWMALHMRSASHGESPTDKEHNNSLPGVDSLDHDAADPENLDIVLKRLPWYSHNLKSTPDLRSEDTNENK